MRREDSVFLRHEACPACGSSDARALYSSGVGFCYRCGATTPPDKNMAPEQPEDGTARTPDLTRRQSSGGLLGPVSITGVQKRGITEETARKWRYGWARKGDETVQVAQYAARGGPEIVAQKWRTRGKDFGWVGAPKAAESLYGRHLWAREDNRGRLVVTEGELDALSVSQVQANRWPVVSLANGAGSAVRAFQENLEWLETFPEVVLMFDQDEEGQKAAQAAAAVLSPGRAKIALLPLKDANEMLMAGRSREIVDAIFGARPWRPDGVLEGDALWAKVTSDASVGSIPYPWSGLNEKLRGLRRKEILMLAAGTGIGKSTLARELGVHLLRSGERLGWIALEESARDTILAMLAVIVGRPLRLETPNWAELRPLWDEHLAGRLVYYDHFGSLDSAKLLSRIRYMVKGCGCGFVGLDHVSIVISGQEGENERKDLDVLMTRLRGLAEETGAGLIVVSHLKRRSQGPGFEEGAAPRLSDLRGSAALEQLSDSVIAMHRDQSKGENTVNLSVLKNRVVGLTGPAGALEWIHEEGRYREISLFEEAAA